MKAIYDYVIVYKVEAVSSSPFRTGDGSDDGILKNDNSYFLQSTSISGVMRNFISVTKGNDLANSFFGSQENEGEIMITDGLFDENVNEISRPRVRISSKTGTAQKGGNFKTNHIEIGSKLIFYIVWQGKKENLSRLINIEMTLSAIDLEQITLGGEKSNGFGKFKISTYKSCFDMRNDKDRQSWLALSDITSLQGQAVDLPKISKIDNYIIEVSGNVDDLIIKSSVIGKSNEEKGSYAQNIKENGKYIIPATSIKGAIRSRMETICDILNMDTNVIEKAFGKSGDDGFIGMLSFEDAIIQEYNAQKVSRIRINKFTGGVINQGLFKEELLHSKIKFKISVASEDKEVISLIIFALRDLGLGLYNLGSGASVGHGYMKVQKIEIKASDNKNAILKFDEHKNCTLLDDSKLIQELLGGIQ